MTASWTGPYGALAMPPGSDVVVMERPGKAIESGRFVVALRRLTVSVTVIAIVSGEAVPETGVPVIVLPETLRLSGKPVALQE